jgi:hypothetical protein
MNGFDVSIKFCVFYTQIAFWEESLFIRLAPFANFAGKRNQNG